LSQRLLRQSLWLPLAALLLPILIGFTAPSYSSLTQHVSELRRLDHPVADAFASHQQLEASRSDAVAE
jgi:hypothetical protein